MKKIVSHAMTLLASNFWSALNQFRKIKAFSLIEIMLGLIVTSVMVAAFAPVITKRVNTSGVSLLNAASGAKIEDKIFSYQEAKNNIDGCKLSSDKLSLECPFIVPSGVNTINMVMVSPGGGGAGAKSVSTSSSSAAYPTTSTSSYTITNDMYNVDIDFMSGGGGGAGGGAATYAYTDTIGTYSGRPSSSAYCKALAKATGLNGAYYDSTNQACISYNQGIMQHHAAKKFAEEHVLTITKPEPSCNRRDENYDPDYPFCNRESDCYHNYGNERCEMIANSYLNIKYKWILPYASYYESLSLSTLSANGMKYIDIITNSGSSEKMYCVRTCDCTNCWCWPKGACFDYHSYFQTCKYSGSWSCKWGDIPSGYEHTSASSDGNTFLVFKSDVKGGFTVGEQTETFYSLSGGGGGSAPAIKSGGLDSSIKNKLNEVIRKNIGGTIVLSVGNGGSGGRGATGIGSAASNGSSGGESCILIKNKSNVVQYKICVPGGNGGYKANASISNVSTNGYGSGASSKLKTNACYALDYTTNTSGVKTTFGCSLSGQAGGNGTSSTSNLATGGSGGASNYNSSTYRPTNSSEQGVSPTSPSTSSTGYPGCGGGGGSVLKTGSFASAAFAFGKGGNGAKGLIKLSFERRFMAPGGGGGGGSMVRIESIPVNPDDVIYVKVGKGGKGGSVDTAGALGGITSVKINGVLYSLTSGKGGALGTNGSASTSTTPGSGGAGSTVPSNFSSLISSAVIAQKQNGSVGSKGAELSNDNGYYGGLGGFSGINNYLYNEPNNVPYSKLSISCGGLYVDDDTRCNLEEKADAEYSISSFSYPNKLYKDKPTGWGSAGSGGGGGGADTLNKISGSGADGQNGYVYLWWQDSDE